MRLTVRRISSLKREEVYDRKALEALFPRLLNDGCFFGRVTASEISGLQSARITQGGATEEECRQNKALIFQALGVKQEGI